MFQRNFSARQFSIPLGIGIIAFIFYFFCLSPTLTYGGDCGELIAASWTGGIPHPTGYPLYAMLGWVFSHLVAIGEVAWRYNLFSAVMGGIAVALVTAAVLRLTQQRLAAIIAGLSLAGCYFFASQSVIAEVYALNGALIALLFYAAIRWKLDRQWRWLSVLALGIGLIPNAHLSSIYLLPGLLIFLWPHQPKVLLQQHFKRLSGLALLVLLGFSCTLYLPWRARQFPLPEAGPGGTLIYQPGDWGHPATLRQWWNHVTAKQYRALLWDNRKIHVGNAQFSIPTFTQPLSHAAGQMQAWLSNVTLQYLWLILFTATGAIACWKIAPRLGWLLWLSFGLNLFFQSNYKVSGVADIANFLFPCYIVIALWTGIGYHAVSKVLLRREFKKQNLGRMALQTLAIAAILIQWITVYPAINHGTDTRALRTAQERAATVQELQNKTGKTVSVLMWGDDTLFPFWYAQRVLGKAATAQTPWGPYRHYYWDNGHKMDLVERIHRQHPLAVAEWDPQINAAFPLVPLNKSGTMWLASNRMLPEPAKVLSGIHSDAVKQKTSFPTLHLPSDIKAGELFAGTLEINYFPDKSTFATRRDAVHHSIQTGWIEVAYDAPPPPHQYGPQEAIPSIAKGFSASRISQRIPLVVPDNLNHPVRLQMILPLQVPRTFPETSCEIWIKAGTGYWEKLAAVSLVH